MTKDYFCTIILDPKYKQTPNISRDRAPAVRTAREEGIGDPWRATKTAQARPRRTRPGKKLSRQHTTSIKEAGWLVDAARKLADVTRISLGLIMPTHGGSPRLKFQPVNGGFKVTVRGRTAIQYVMVYTKDSASTQKLLEEAFLEKC